MVLLNSALKSINSKYRSIDILNLTLEFFQMQHSRDRPTNQNEQRIDTGR